MTAAVEKNLPDIECMLKVKVGKFGVVCLPSQEGSTGYHWILPTMPNCINRTADGWIPALHGPVFPGEPGFHYFVFRGVTKTATPAKMTFHLVPPAGHPVVQNAICTVIVE